MSSFTSRRGALHAAALLATGSGLTKAIRAKRHRARDHRLFILEYHDVSVDDSEFEGTISQTRFRRHLKWLRSRFRIATLGESIDKWASDLRSDGDRLVVTFDDGYEGNSEAAWPVLQELGAPATIFLTTGFLDGHDLWFDLARRALTEARKSPASLSAEVNDALLTAFGRWPSSQRVEDQVKHIKYLEPGQRAHLLGALEQENLPLAPAAKALTWDQVRDMERGGIEFGGHTVTHPILSLLPRQEQKREITESRRRILEETGVEPKTFAYPNGSARDFTADTVDIVREAGYQASCTTQKGSNRPGCDRLTLRRIGIGSDPTWVVEARLSGLLDQIATRPVSGP